MSSAPEPTVAPAADEAHAQLELVVDDLVRARAELAAATEEADLAGAELRRRTTEIDELNDLLEATLAVTDEVVLVVAADTRRVRAWSAGAARRFGLAPDEVVGRALTSVRGRGLPAARLVEEVARLAHPAPAAGPRVVTVERGDDRYRLAAVPADPASPVRSVVVRLVPRRSDVHAGSEPADDAGQPA
jgi:PAS domain-containing protein